LQLMTLAHEGPTPPSPPEEPDGAPLEAEPLDVAPLEVVVPLDVVAPLEAVPLDGAPLEVVPLDVVAPLDPALGAPEEELVPDELEAPLPADAPPQEELQLCWVHCIKLSQSELVQLEAAMHVLSADEQLLLTHVLHVWLAARPSGSLHPPPGLLNPPLLPEVAPLQPVANSRSREPTTISMATRIFEFIEAFLLSKMVQRSVIDERQRRSPAARVGTRHPQPHGYADPHKT
jgi:hypothetical protein